MEIRNMITAAQKAFIMTPPSSRESLLSMVFPRVAPAIVVTNANTRRLPAKEKSVTPGKYDKPSNIARIAPMAEPPDIPSI
jgi:hypothetical protein